MTDSLSAKKIDEWGLIQWIKPLINIVFSGQSEVIDYQMEHLLSEEQYYRFQLDYINSGSKDDTPLSNNSDDVDDAMDNVSPENINNIKIATKKFIEIEKEESKLRKLCDVLIASLDTRELPNKKKI